jgi:hypothetical protein
MRLLLAAALLEEGESLVQRIAAAISSAKASATHLCLTTCSPGQRFKQAAFDNAPHGAQIVMAHFDRAGPCQQLEIARKPAAVNLG